MVEYKKKTLAKQHKCSSAIKTVCGKQEVELRTKKKEYNSGNYRAQDARKM